MAVGFSKLATPAVSLTALYDLRGTRCWFFFHSGTGYSFLMVLLRLHGSDVAQWWKWKHSRDARWNEVTLETNKFRCSSSFFSRGGGIRSVSFERDPFLLLFLRMFVRMLEISRIRFLDVVNSSFTMSFSIFLYPPLNYLTQKTEFVHARRGDFRSFDQLPDYRDDSNSFPRSIVINRISIA